MEDGRIVQHLAELEDFEKTAILVQQVYKDSSPTFVDRKNPLL